MNVGDRVRVKLLPEYRAQYAEGAAKCLDGALGTVEQAREHSVCGANGNEPARLVRFDVPRPKWWKDQTPCAAFWFGVDELEAVAS